MLDLNSEYVARPLISSLTQTNSDSAIVSNIIDLEGMSAAEIILNIGSLTDVDATFAVLFEHGNDSALSDNATVLAADLIGAPANFTFAADNTMQQWGYIGIKRYLRLTITPTGNNSGSASLGAVAFLKKKKTGAL